MLTAKSYQFSEKFNGAAVVMGVASCGKTTVGEALALSLSVSFVEGDRLHPPENIAKMSAGIPLDDHDRLPWLRKVGGALAGTSGVIASCSALKRRYRREIIQSAGRPVFFIFLHGTRDLLAARIAARNDHFMPASLLDSQLSTLEVPDAVEQAVAIDITNPVDNIVTQAVVFLTAGVRELQL